MSFLDKISKEEISLKKFPIEIVRKESRGAVIFLMIFGLVFCSVPVIGAVQAFLVGKLTTKIILIMVPFFIIGVGALVFGFIKKIEIKIDFDSVTYNYRSLFKHNKWIEVFSNYKGILHKLEYSGDRQYNVLKLYHEDPEKTILLSRYLFFWVSENEVRAKWEEYSRVFKLPAMRETSNGIEERLFEDLDKSTRDLLEDGKVPFDESTLIKPPSGIKVYFEKGAHVLAITKKTSLSPMLILLAAIIFLFVYFGFFFKENPSINFIMTGIFGSILGTYVFIYLLFDFFTTKVIKCSYDKIQILRKTPFGETRGKILKVSDIEEIYIAKSEYYNREALIILTDEEKINIGMYLPNDVLNWIRDFIYSKSIKE